MVAARLHHVNEIVLNLSDWEVQETWKALEQVVPLVRSYVSEFQEHFDQDGVTPERERTKLPMDMETRIIFDYRLNIDERIYRHVLIFNKKRQKIARHLVDSLVRLPKADMSQMMKSDSKKTEEQTEDEKLYQQPIRDMLLR